MRKTRIIALALAATGLFAATGCDKKEKKETGKLPNAKDIVIFAGGSSEFSWSLGTKGQEVIDYIEKAFYEDTGKAVNFVVDVTQQGPSMNTTLPNDVTEGKVDVVISHTSGGDGIDDNMFNNELYYDLSRYMDSYFGEQIEDGNSPFVWKSADGSKTLDGLKRLTAQTDDGEQIIGIPSVINPYKFGILVRKDWMREAGYTDDPAEEGKTYVGDFETFTQMALDIKKNEGLDHAITGAMFDVEKVGLLGAYGIDAGYYTNTVYTEGENSYVGPGYINPKYADVLALEYEWKTKGILEADCDNTLVATGENNFIAGKSAIFVQDPTITHLIEIARRTKAADPTAEFTVLGALTKDKNSTDKGFMRNSTATFAASVGAKSKVVGEIMAFVNWMYSDKDNYLLCKYGREGTDWIYDEANQTYNYKTEAEYVSPNYSGILCLVENQNVANLTYAGYSAEEKKWIATAENPTNYRDNPTIDYLLLFPNGSELNTAKGNAASAISENVVRKIWNGDATFAGKIAEKFEQGRLGFVSTASNYMKEMYKLYSDLSK